MLELNYDEICSPQVDFAMLRILAPKEPRKSVVEFCAATALGTGRAQVLRAVGSSSL